MAGKKKYLDLRYMFMRGLIQRERWQRTRHYLKSAAECTSRAVVSLELAENPVKSIAQAKQLEGIGGETLQRLKEIQEKKEKSTERPPDGKFVSSAAALLVVLLDLTEQVENSGTGDLPLIAEDVLKCEAKPLCEEVFVEDDSGFCQAWWRIEVLIKRGLVKRRQLQKADVYQLMVLGREIAHRLRTDREAVMEKNKPLKSSGSTGHKVNTESKITPSTSTASNVTTPEAYLYANDVGLDGIILEVDTQEMGGDRVGLGEHCNRLERCGVRYRTCRLPCGDYRWVWRCEGTERTIPLLVERKRGDDIAHSLKDGRFWRQVTKMLDWKEEFKKKDIVARLVYVIEGDPADYVVRCGDGCQGVGRCGNPTLTQVKLALKDLEEHPELEIRRTSCVESTVQYLSIVTEEIGKRANKGEYDMLIVSEMVDIQADDKKSVEVVELEDTPPDDVKEDNGVVMIEDTRTRDVRDKKSQGCKMETDSLVNNTLNASFEDLPSFMNDSEELPPLDQSPNSGTGLTPNKVVRKRNLSQPNSFVSTGSGCKTNSTKSKVKEDVPSCTDDVIDIEAELAIFSSFSEHSKMKRTLSDDVQGIPKKALSPLKKMKLNFKGSEDCVETQTTPSQVSPRHGKVYLMKMSRNKTNLTQKLNECVTGPVSSTGRKSSTSDRHCVDLSPRRGDLNSSPEQSCSRLESRPHQSDSGKLENEHNKQDTNDTWLKVKFPFKSGKSTENSTPSKVSEFTHTAQASTSENVKTEQENLFKKEHQTASDRHPVDYVSSAKHTYSSHSFEPDVSASPKKWDPRPSAKMDPGDSDSDSLPDVGLSDIVPSKLDPVASTSGVPIGNSEIDLSIDNLDVVLKEDTSSLPSGKKRRKRSPRGKKQLADSDEDMTLLDSDTDYVPETSRRGRKRNSSKYGKMELQDSDEDVMLLGLDTDYMPESNRHSRKKNSPKSGKKAKPVDESLIAQVADILPHCSRDQIRATLVKCKMNIERTVAELLDSDPQDVDVVDLT